MSGQAVAFQSGFTVTELAASRFVPAGTGPWRLNRVHFLFGGSTATQTITLHVYDDTAGTLVPGTELFVGDFSVTGSNTEMQEADLTSANVQVSGQFRVAIEFQHSGLPSVARDSDGTIQTTRNFIFSTLWFQSSTFGVTGDWIIRAGVEEVGVGGGYFTVAPCRVVDTRGGALVGGPALLGQQTRTLAVAGNCAIPVTAKAVSVNLAVTQPTAAGNVRLFPAGQAVPTVSSINYAPGQTRGNNAIVQLAPTGAIAAFVGQPAGTTVHLILDVNGYFE